MPGPCRASCAAEDMSPVLGDALCFASERLGSAPDARAFFLLLRQKKEAKEKATPTLRARLRRVPCATRQAGRLRNSGLRPSDSPRRQPPARLRCSALYEGERKNTERNRYRWRLMPDRFSISPLRRRAAQDATGKKGEDCLRGKAPSSAALPLRLSSAEHPAQAGRRGGRAFSLATFFWQDKRKYARASGAEPSASATDFGGKAPTDNPE